MATKEDKYKVTYRGKDYEVTAKELEKLKDQIFGRLDGYIKALISSNKQNQKTVLEYQESAEIRNGFFAAVTQAVVVRAGRVKYPNPALASTSNKACENLARAVGSRNLAQLSTALPLAERAVNAFTADVMRFLNEFIGSAGTTATVLQVTSATCFAVVGALAAPILITGGMSAGAAAAATGGGVSVLSSAANELGSAAAGQNVSLWDSVKNIGIDGTIGAATAGIASKIPLGFVEKMAKGLAGRLASKVPGFSASQLQPIIVKYLTTTGEEVIKSAIGEAINIVGKIAKTGKAPTEKDFEEAAMKVLVTALTAGLLKSLSFYQKKWAVQSRATLEGQLLPDALAKLMKGKNQLPPIIKAKVWAEVMGKVSEQALQAGTAQVLDSAKAGFDEAKMTSEADRAIRNDARLRKLIEEEMKKALKKQKIEVK